MSESRVRENRTHGSMRRREAARCRWPSGPKGRGASRRPYKSAEVRCCSSRSEPTLKFVQGGSLVDFG
jgi:hypothetical protein